jgi:hypothetical protein
MTSTLKTTEARELDARAGDGIDVRLLWYPATNTVTVSVLDATRDRSFELAVEPAEAVDAFNHPFAYAAFRGVGYSAPLRAQHGQPNAA